MYKVKENTAFLVYAEKLLWAQWNMDFTSRDENLEETNTGYKGAKQAHK